MTATPTAVWKLPLYDGTEAAGLKTIANALSNALESSMNANSISFFLSYSSLAALQANTTAAKGQHAIVEGDPTASNNGDYQWTGSTWIARSVAPFAEAAGTGSNTAGAYTTITFPAGRFTVPPIITGNTIGAQPAIFHVNSSGVTATSAQVGGFVGQSAVASSWQWRAVQMTATSAAG